MERKTLHYWRIHARVARRILTDMSEYNRNVISSDVAHTGETFKWFENKAKEDAEKLYNDESYYDNQSHTFRISKLDPRR